MYADLHNHTTASDGEYTPEELVAAAHGLGTRFVGVTDHDTLEGVLALPRAALFGFLEMTNGVNALPATRTGFVLCAAIMNWGGLSVQAQTCAMLAGSALSARRCVIGKAVQALAGVPLALLAAQRLF